MSERRPLSLVLSLSTRVCICLSAFLSVYVSACQSASYTLFISIFLHMSVYLSLYISVFLSFFTSINPSASVCLCVYLCTYLFFYVCVYVSLCLCLSVHISLCLRLPPFYHCLRWCVSVRLCLHHLGTLLSSFPSPLLPSLHSTPLHPNGQSDSHSLRQHLLMWMLSNVSC